MTKTIVSKYLGKDVYAYCTISVACDLEPYYLLYGEYLNENEKNHKPHK